MHIHKASMDEIAELLYRHNPWWSGEAKSDLIERPAYASKLEALEEKRDIVLLAGLRRVGKTTLLRQQILHLLKKEKPEHILYAPLDAYGFMGLSIHDIVREFRRAHQLDMKEKAHLFLDEVASKKDFQVELKDFHDNENVKVYASSSSASLMKEKASYLTGRTRTVEVLPLSFREYLMFRGKGAAPGQSHLLEAMFDEYMFDGGMPEYVLSRDPNDLNKIIDDIITKDIYLKHSFDNKTLLRDMFKLLCERVGKRTTVSRLANILEVSRDTVSRMMSHFEETYLFYSIPMCGTLNERLKSPKKTYIGDVGLRNITTGFRDKGAVYENLVFLALKNSEPCYYAEGGSEIDFKAGGSFVEAKYGKELSDGQAKLIERLGKRHKIIMADGYKFFYE